MDSGTTVRKSNHIKSKSIDFYPTKRSDISSAGRIDPKDLGSFRCRYGYFESEKLNQKHKSQQAIGLGGPHILEKEYYPDNLRHSESGGHMISTAPFNKFTNNGQQRCNTQPDYRSTQQLSEINKPYTFGNSMRSSTSNKNSQDMRKWGAKLKHLNKFMVPTQDDKMKNIVC
jgi:hypothetical protein